MFTMAAMTLTFIGIIITWWVLYTLFTNQSRTQIAFAITIATIFSLPYISGFAFKFCAEINRRMFAMNESGEVPLAYSPMRIPDNYKGDDYCNRFTDENGHQIKVVSHRDDGRYCGFFWEMYEKKVIFIPYKNLPNDKVIYWASPDTRIVGSSSLLQKSKK